MFPRGNLVSRCKVEPYDADAATQRVDVNNRYFKEEEEDIFDVPTQVVAENDVEDPRTDNQNLLDDGLDELLSSIPLPGDASSNQQQAPYSSEIESDPDVDAYIASSPTPPWEDATTERELQSPGTDDTEVYEYLPPSAEPRPIIIKSETADVLTQAYNIATPNNEGQNSGGSSPAYILPTNANLADDGEETGSGLDEAPSSFIPSVRHVSPVPDDVNCDEETDSDVELPLIPVVPPSPEDIGGGDETDSDVEEAPKPSLPLIPVVPPLPDDIDGGDETDSDVEEAPKPLIPLIPVIPPLPDDIDGGDETDSDVEEAAKPSLPLIPVIPPLPEDIDGGDETDSDVEEAPKPSLPLIPVVPPLPEDIDGGDETDSDLEEALKSSPPAIHCIPPLPEDFPGEDEDTSNESLPLVPDNLSSDPKQPNDDSNESLTLIPGNLPSDPNDPDDDKAYLASTQPYSNTNSETVKAAPCTSEVDKLPLAGSPIFWNQTQSFTQETQEFEPLSLEMPSTQDFEDQLAKASRRGRLAIPENEEPRSGVIRDEELLGDWGIQPKNERIFLDETQATFAVPHAAVESPRRFRKSKLEESVFLQETQVLDFQPEVGNPSEKDESIFLEATQVPSTSTQTPNYLDRSIFQEETQVFRHPGLIASSQRYKQKKSISPGGKKLKTPASVHRDSNTTERDDSIFLECTQVFGDEGIPKKDESIFFEETQIFDQSEGKLSATSQQQTDAKIFLEETQCLLDSADFSAERQVPHRGEENLRSDGSASAKRDSGNVTVGQDFDIFDMMTQPAPNRCPKKNYLSTLTNKSSVPDNPSIFTMDTECQVTPARDETHKVERTEDDFNACTQVVPLPPEDVPSKSQPCVDPDSSEIESDPDIDGFIASSPITAYEEELNHQTVNTTVYDYDDTFESQSKKSGASVKPENLCKDDILTQVYDLPQNSNFESRPRPSVGLLKSEYNQDAPTQVYRNNIVPASDSGDETIPNIEPELLEVPEGPASPPLDFDGPSQMYGMNFSSPPDVCNDVIERLSPRIPSSASHLPSEDVINHDDSKDSASFIQGDSDRQIYDSDKDEAYFVNTQYDSSLVAPCTESQSPTVPNCYATSSTSNVAASNLKGTLNREGKLPPTSGGAGAVMTSHDSVSSCHESVGSQEAEALSPKLPSTPEFYQQLAEAEAAEKQSQAAEAESCEEMPSKQDFEQQLAEAEAAEKERMTQNATGETSRKRSSCDSEGELSGGRPKRVRKATWKVCESELGKSTKSASNSLDSQEEVILPGRKRNVSRILEISSTSQESVILPRGRRNVARLLESSASATSQESLLMSVRSTRSARSLDSSSSSSQGYTAPGSSRKRLSRERNSLNEQRSTRTRLSARTAHVSESSPSESEESASSQQSSSAWSRGRASLRRKKKVRVVCSDSAETLTDNESNVSNIENDGVPRTIRQSRMQVAFVSPPSRTISDGVTALGGTIVDVELASVLVSNRLQRSFEVLMALARGIPIVPSTWLAECRKHGSWLSPRTYLLQDTAAEAEWNFKLSNCLLRASKSKLLAGYRVFATENVSLRPYQIHKLVLACGGKVIRETPRSWPKASLFVTCQADERLWPSKRCRNVTLVDVEFLIHGIIHRELNFDAFALRTQEVTKITQKK